MVFPKLRVAVFIDGCFWHSCPRHGSVPKTNAQWWQDKLRRNVARDRETDALLGVAGWTPLRVWEHEPAIDAADRVEQVIRELQARLA